MHSPEHSDGTCYFLRMPLELREEIYRLVMLSSSCVAIGGKKPSKNLESINDSGDESDYSDLFVEAQRGMGDFFPRTRAEFYHHSGVPLIEQAGKMESEAECETDEEGSIKEERAFKREGNSEETEDIRDKDMESEGGAEWETDEEWSIRGERAFKREVKSEETEDVQDEDMESEDKGHDLALVSSARHNKGAMMSDFALAILRTCRQVYAEASPLFYSMVELVITPEEVVDRNDEEDIIEINIGHKRIRPDFIRHFLYTHYEEGIFETLGLASLLDSATFTRLERICFDAHYNFLIIDDSPSLYVDEDFHTSPNDEAELMSFMKRTRTVENFVSLLATLPRLRQLTLRLVIEVKHQVDLGYDDLDSDDEEDDEADSMDFEKTSVANQRATELFMECGMLDPLRKLSNVQNFDLEVETEGREMDDSDDKLKFLVLKPKHAKIAQDLKEAIEHNWTARSSIH